MIKTERQSAKSAKDTIQNRQPTAEEIAARAHQLFVERGGEQGHDLEDWFQAERELSHNGHN